MQSTFSFRTNAIACGFRRRIVTALGVKTFKWRLNWKKIIIINKNRQTRSRVVVYTRQQTRTSAACKRGGRSETKFFVRDWILLSEFPGKRLGFTICVRYFSTIQSGVRRIAHNSSKTRRYVRSVRIVLMRFIKCKFYRLWTRKLI